MMRIFGLDFTSKPSAAAASPSKFKGLTLANCWLNKRQLTVMSLDQLNGNYDGDFSLFSNWLRADGRWSKETQWHAAIDFPLGLPVEAIEYFGWLEYQREQNWNTYVSEIFSESENVEQFEKRLHSWTKRGKDGSTKRVFLLRRTDKLAGFAGASPSSPMKVHPQCNPAVGRMFFVGAKCLLDSGVSIHPMRITDSERSVVESYPKLVADQFLNGAKYKDGKGFESERETILANLELPNDYGVTVDFKSESDRTACIQDAAGDQLDSVLSAVQAAWSFLYRQQYGPSRSSLCGMPNFTVPALTQTAKLEGWIADPLLLRAIGKE